MTKSMVLADLCVVNLIWLVRLKHLRRSKKVLVSGQFMSFVLMLKLPVSTGLPATLILISIRSKMSRAKGSTLFIWRSVDCN